MLVEVVQHCEPNDVDVVVSSPDVNSLLDVPLISSCDDCDDVSAAAAALLPCDNRCRKEEQRCLRCMQGIVDVFLFSSDVSSPCLPALL